MYKNISIVDLNISPRAYNALKAGKLRTVQDIFDFGLHNLWRLRNCGRNSIYEILEAVSTVKPDLDNSTHLLSQTKQDVSLVFMNDFETKVLKLIVELGIKMDQILKDQKDPEEVFSRKEAAKFLGITLVTLRDWTKRGLLKSGNIGSRVFYKKSDLLKAIK